MGIKISELSTVSEAGSEAKLIINSTDTSGTTATAAITKGDFLADYIDITLGVSGSSDYYFADANLTGYLDQYLGEQGYISDFNAAMSTYLASSAADLAAIIEPYLSGITA